MKIDKLIKTLKEKNLTIAIVESCTAGYLSYLLTKTAGSSEVFRGGIVAYSLEVKNKFFKIPFYILKKTKGVSEKIASLLAEKIKKLLNADIGVSVVGFAGPKAKKGTKVGTIYIAVSYKNCLKTKKIFIKGERDKIRKKSSILAVGLIYNTIAY